MWAFNSKAVLRPIAAGKQRGAAALEFALVAIVFFTVVFGVIELARAMYIFNTLQEVTRRAAAAAVKTNFSDAELQGVRERAIFRASPGELTIAAPITDKHIRIDYLSIAAASGGALSMTPIPTGSLPSNPAQNRAICMKNPNDPSCIRLVRVRVCEPGGVGDDPCDKVPYKTIVSLISLPIFMPLSTTIMQTEALGFQPGMAPGP